MPTSHFLGQVWEFPICGSAPAQRNQDHSDFGSVSSYFSCPPSCSWYLFPIAMRFGSEAAPALPGARQKRLSGAVGSVWSKPGAAPWCCSGRRQSGGIPAASSCRIPALLAGVWWGRWLQTALESSGFSPGWQLGSVGCVCPPCHCRVPCPCLPVGCHVSTGTWLTLALLAPGRALTQPEHCHFSHWKFLRFLPQISFYF